MLTGNCNGASCKILLIDFQMYAPLEIFYPIILNSGFLRHFEANDDQSFLRQYVLTFYRSIT